MLVILYAECREICSTIFDSEWNISLGLSKDVRIVEDRALGIYPNSVNALSIDL